MLIASVTLVLKSQSYHHILRERAWWAFWTPCSIKSSLKHNVVSRRRFWGSFEVRLLIFIYLQTFVPASRTLQTSLFSLILHPAGERRSSIHLTAARLKQIKLIVARIGPLVLQFLKGVINCIPVVCCFFLFFFSFLTGSRGQSHVGGVWSPLWPGPWMRVEF